MKKNVLFLAAGFLTVVIFIGLRKNSAPFFSVTEYQCIQDGVLSDEYYGAINGALSDLLKNSCAAHVIIDQLKNQFPALKKIVISYRPSATRVKISAYEPICSVNNSVILTEHNELFPKNVFAVDAVVDVPNIAVTYDDMAHMPHYVSCLLQGLSSDIHQMYNLELMNEHCVHFVDKQQPQFTIVSSLAQEKSPQLLSQCATIKKTIDERKGV